MTYFSHHFSPAVCRLTDSDGVDEQETKKKETQLSPGSCTQANLRRGDEKGAYEGEKVWLLRVTTFYDPFVSAVLSTQKQLPSVILNVSWLHECQTFSTRLHRQSLSCSDFVSNQKGDRLTHHSMISTISNPFPFLPSPFSCDPPSLPPIPVLFLSAD